MSKLRSEPAAKAAECTWDKIPTYKDYMDPEDVPATTPPQFAVGDEVMWCPWPNDRSGDSLVTIVYIDAAGRRACIKGKHDWLEVVYLDCLRPAPPATEEIEVTLREYVDHVKGRTLQWTTRDVAEPAGRTATVKFTVPKRGGK